LRLRCYSVFGVFQRALIPFRKSGCKSTTFFPYTQIIALESRKNAGIYPTFAIFGLQTPW